MMLYNVLECRIASRYTFVIMKKGKTKQANFRLPAELIEEIADLTTETKETQTAFVTKALRSRVGQVRKRISRREAESVPA